MHNCGAEPGASSGNEDSFASEIRHDYSFDVLCEFVLQALCSISILQLRVFSRAGFSSSIGKEKAGRREREGETREEASRRLPHQSPVNSKNGTARGQ